MIVVIAMIVCQHDLWRTFMFVLFLNHEWDWCCIKALLKLFDVVLLDSSECHLHYCGFWHSLTMFFLDTQQNWFSRNLSTIKINYCLPKPLESYGSPPIFDCFLLATFTSSPPIFQTLVEQCGNPNYSNQMASIIMRYHLWCDVVTIRPIMPIFTLLPQNTGFVKSAIQYVKVHMNKLLQTHRFQWKYDHVLIVLAINKQIIILGTFISMCLVINQITRGGHSIVKLKTICNGKKSTFSKLYHQNESNFFQVVFRSRYTWYL